MPRACEVKLQVMGADRRRLDTSPAESEPQSLGELRLMKIPRRETGVLRVLPRVLDEYFRTLG